MVIASLDAFDSGILHTSLFLKSETMLVTKDDKWLLCGVCYVAETSLGKHRRGCGGNRTELGYNSNTCDLMIDLLSGAAIRRRRNKQQQQKT